LVKVDGLCKLFPASSDASDLRECADAMRVVPEGVLVRSESAIGVGELLRDGACLGDDYNDLFSSAGS
jgi:hypothetical protein